MDSIAIDVGYYNNRLIEHYRNGITQLLIFGYIYTIVLFTTILFALNYTNGNIDFNCNAYIYLYMILGAFTPIFLLNIIIQNINCIHIYVKNKIMMLFMVVLCNCILMMMIFYSSDNCDYNNIIEVEYNVRIICVIIATFVNMCIIKYTHTRLYYIIN